MVSFCPGNEIAMAAASCCRRLSLNWQTEKKAAKTENVSLFKFEPCPLVATLSTTHIPLPSSTVATHSHLSLLYQRRRVYNIAISMYIVYIA